jgi:Putative F0F1-ATPase subunit Ca2+/Mg2+ transporter
MFRALLGRFYRLSGLVNFFTRYDILHGQSQSAVSWVGDVGAEVGDNGLFAMPDTKRDGFLERSARSLQENAERAGPAAGASYSLIGAILFLGGIGYGIDRWRGTSPWFLAGGLLLGIVVGLYGLARTIWHR